MYSADLYLCSSIISILGEGYHTTLKPTFVEGHEAILTRNESCIWRVGPL